MSVRHAVAVGALAAGLLALPVASSQAAAPTSNCSHPEYPPSKPKLTLTLSPSMVTAGQSSTAMGSFTQNKCYIRGAKIQLQKRYLINGKPSGSFKTFTTVTTDNHGLYKGTIKVIWNNQIRAYFQASGKFPTTASSPRSLFVRTKISFSATNVKTCSVRVSGRTYPSKTQRLVTIQWRKPSGQFDGWHKLFTTHTGGKGGYVATHRVTCGKTYNLAAFIDRDQHNAASRSKTQWSLKIKR